MCCPEQPRWPPGDTTSDSRKGKYDGSEEKGHEESDRTETGLIEKGALQTGRRWKDHHRSEAHGQQGPAENERLGRGGEGALRIEATTALWGVDRADGGPGVLEVAGRQDAGSDSFRGLDARDQHEGTRRPVQKNGPRAVRGECVIRPTLRPLWFFDEVSPFFAQALDLGPDVRLTVLGLSPRSVSAGGRFPSPVF